jgi:hypothetical protein
MRILTNLEGVFFFSEKKYILEKILQISQDFQQEQFAVPLGLAERVDELHVKLPENHPASSPL